MSVDRGVPDERYATLLRDLAGAMSGDDDVAAAVSEAVVTDLFPDVARELDVPADSAAAAEAEAAAAAVADVGKQSAAAAAGIAPPTPAAQYGQLLRAGGGGGVAWRDDEVFGTRLHLLLRLLPYAAPRIGRTVGPDPHPPQAHAAPTTTSSSSFECAAASLLTLRALPAALRCLHHPRAAVVRAAHVAHVAVFRAHPALHDAAFPPYLEAALMNFPTSTPAEPFVAAVGTVAKYGHPGRGQVTILYARLTLAVLFFIFISFSRS